jgi:predicted RNA-binding Zn ribbon-like protein
MGLARQSAPQSKDDAEKEGFLFLGNQLALDFLNTRPLVEGEPLELLPTFTSVLRWFQAAGLLTSRQAATLRSEWEGSVRASGVADDLRAFREKLRQQVVAWEGGASLNRSMASALNRIMALHPIHTQLRQAGRFWVREFAFYPKTPEDLFAPLAHEAAKLFTDVDASRVRKCDSCILHFLDTSKKGTRRWCSMQLCGNRLKVAAYAARQRDRGVAWTHLRKGSL